MKYLLDTHLLLWVAENNPALPLKAIDIINDKRNSLYFSAASIWEISIKNSLAREDFYIDNRLLRIGLLENGYKEISISSEHTLHLEALPPIHKDPFDRILMSQSMSESMYFLTVDKAIHAYNLANLIKL